MLGDLLRQLPTAIHQVYIVNARYILLSANPESVRLILGATAEIVNIVDVDWRCNELGHVAAFDHNTVDGVVNIEVTLPTCAYLRFKSGGSGFAPTADGHLYRSDTMSYELPELRPGRPAEAEYWEPPFYFGRRMIVHVRPNGPARFIIEHGEPGGIAWFDAP
jgi:hypothetical protein